MENLDNFLDNLQEKIFNTARGELGEKGFNRWQNPCYNGKMSDADAHASIKGSCGDTMEIFLKFNANRVVDASYVTDGCASSAISGSFAAELAIGKEPDELTDITGDVVLETIGRLPEDDRHCADLAAETLQVALNNYMIEQKESS